MKKIVLSAAVVALSIASCKKDGGTETTTTTTTTTTTAADSSATANNAPADDEKPRDSVAEMQAWQAYMTPGEAHKVLADEAGTWTAEMTFWHDENSQPEKATSTADVKMILGGRYQEMNYKGKVMGMPFEGRSTVAFDNTTKEYISTWIDNMGTGMMVAKGKMNADGKTMELHGEMVDPVDGKAGRFKEVYTIVDNNTRKMEMYDMKNGKEFKNMEIVMRRKK